MKKYEMGRNWIVEKSGGRERIRKVDGNGESSEVMLVGGNGNRIGEENT